MNLRTLISFSQHKYLQSVLIKVNCLFEHYVRRSRYGLFLNKYVVTFRGIIYASNAANFELTKIDNIFKCLGGFDKLEVRTLRGGVLRKRAKVFKEGVGPTIDEIDRT